MNRPYSTVCAERRFSSSSDVKTFVSLRNAEVTLKNYLSLRTGFSLSSLSKEI